MTTANQSIALLLVWMQECQNYYGWSLLSLLGGRGRGCIWWLIQWLLVTSLYWRYTAMPPYTGRGRPGIS